VAQELLERKALMNRPDIIRGFFLVQRDGLLECSDNPFLSTQVEKKE
jgi:hypothetical protein